MKIVTTELEIIKDKYNKIQDNKVGLKEKIIANEEETDIVKKLLTLKLQELESKSNRKIKIINKLWLENETITLKYKEEISKKKKLNRIEN